MQDREWSRSRFWLCHFLNNRHDRVRIDFKCATDVESGNTFAAMRFLSQALAGQPDSGRWMVDAALADCASDPAYIQCLRLFAREESALRELTDKVLNATGRRRVGPRLWERLWWRVRLAMGLRFELANLLLRELLDLACFQAVRQCAKSAVVGGLCQQVIQDRQAHAAFHAERLTMEFADFNFFRRNLRRWRLRGVFAAKMLVLLACHGDMVRAAGQSRMDFVRSCWATFSRVLERMVPYHRDALLAALLQQRQRPYDQPVRVVAE